MTLPEFDHDAMKREGFTPYNCGGCGRTLAMQSSDGNTLQVNGIASMSGQDGRIYVRCACGYSNKWRPTRGKKSQKPSVSYESLKKS
jgi:hypothetical protein